LYIVIVYKNNRIVILAEIGWLILVKYKTPKIDIFKDRFFLLARCI